MGQNRYYVDFLMADLHSNAADAVARVPSLSFMAVADFALEKGKIRVEDSGLFVGLTGQKWRGATTIPT